MKSINHIMRPLLAIAFIVLSVIPGHCGVGCVDYWSAGADGLYNAYDFVCEVYIYVMWIVFAIAADLFLVGVWEVSEQIKNEERDTKLNLYKLLGGAIFLVISVRFFPALFGFCYTG
ncbi:MAG: DUF4134 domain-containing protein [Bacteroidales bacterium]|nr:DUF4134 domain-containing protein [Bacteroidales bacterium]